MAEIYDPDAVEGEEYVQEEQKQYEIFKEQIVVLIDAGDNMLGTWEEENDKATYLQAAVRATASIMRQRIRYNTNDEVALLFYGTAHGNQDAKGFTNVRVDVPLDVPDAETICRLENFTLEDFQEQVGAASGVDASDDLRYGLWAARDQFTSRNTRATKRVLLFSNNQNPLEAGDPTTAAHRREALLQRAQDVADAGVVLDFFPLAAAQGEPFDLGPFWDGLLAAASTGEEGSDDDLDDAQSSVEDLHAMKLQASMDKLDKLVNQRTTRKRPLAKLTFTLAPNVDLMVKLFCMVQPASKRWAVSVTAQDYGPIKVTTGYMNTATGNLVSDANISKLWKPKEAAKTQRFPEVLLTKSEVKALKGVRPRGLALLGVKPLSWLRPWYQMNHAYFVYPYEKDATGSTAAFVALHTSCLQRELCAVVRYVSREGVPPVLGVLLPQQEVVEDGTPPKQVTPPGFHLLLLPYQEDVRWQEITPGVLGDIAHPPRATAAQVAAAEALVAALTLDEEQQEALRTLRNPAIARQQEVIEATALQEKVEANPVDDTLDAFKGVPAGQEAAAPEVWAAFKEACYAGVEAKPAKAAAKRKQAPEVTAGDEYEQYDWRHMAESETLLKKLTMDKLKVYLKYHKLTTSGVKAELVERVKQHALGG